MRVCILACGMTNSSIPLAENLHKKGYEVGYYQFMFSGTTILDYLELDRPMRFSLTPQKLPDRNVVYKYLSTDVPVYLQWVLKERKRLEKNMLGATQRRINRFVLKRFCKKYISGNYDIVNVIAYPRFFVDICDVLSDLRVPYFVTFHEILKSHSVGYEILPFVKDILKYNTPIVLHSRKSEEDLVKLSNVPNIQQRCHIVNFGPYEGNYCSYQEGVKCVDVKNYLLYFGNILPYKGLRYLYDAVSEIVDIPELKIVVAGSGYDSVLEQMKEDCRFTVLNRYVLNEEISYLVNNCKGVVCPYIGGSQSGVVQTAMAYKKPVIATDVAAFSECIKDGVNGWLVEPKNSQQLGQAIRRLYHINNSQTSDYFVPKEYSWSYIISLYERLFNDVFANK